MALDKSQFCRLCTKSNKTNIHLFSKQGKDRALNCLIKNTLQIHIGKNDFLPKFICICCVGKLEFIRKFQHNCQSAQLILKEKLQKQKNLNTNFARSKTKNREELSQSNSISKSVISNLNIIKEVRVVIKKDSWIKNDNECINSKTKNSNISKVTDDTNNDTIESVPEIIEDNEKEDTVERLLKDKKDCEIVDLPKTVNNKQITKQVITNFTTENGYQSNKGLSDTKQNNKQLCGSSEEKGGVANITSTLRSDHLKTVVSDIDWVFTEGNIDTNSQTGVGLSQLGSYPGCVLLTGTPIVAENNLHTMGVAQPQSVVGDILIPKFPITAADSELTSVRKQEENQQLEKFTTAEWRENALKKKVCHSQMIRFFKLIVRKKIKASQLERLNTDRAGHIQCPRCRKMIPKNGWPLFRHMQNHLLLSCFKCSKPYSSVTCYKKHLCNYHKDEKNLSFKCFVCKSVSFTSYKKLFTHLHDHLNCKICVYCSWSLPSKNGNDDITDLMENHVKEKHRTKMSEFLSANEINNRRISDNCDNNSTESCVEDVEMLDADWFCHAVDEIEPSNTDVIDPLKFVEQSLLSNQHTHTNTTTKSTKSYHYKTYLKLYLRNIHKAALIKSALLNCEKAKGVSDFIPYVENIIYGKCSVMPYFQMCVEANSSNLIVSFVCFICDFCIFTRKAIMTHLLEHCYYKCTVCCVTFRELNSFRLHMKEHFKSSSSSIRCDFCNKIYNNFDIYFEHIKSHYYFSCGDCQYKSNNLANIDIHIKARHKQKNIDDFDCSAFYQDQMTLKNHIVQLSTSHKFICVFCGMAFHNAMYLKIHLEIFDSAHGQIKPVTSTTPSDYQSTYIKNVSSVVNQQSTSSENDDLNVVKRFDRSSVDSTVDFFLTSLKTDYPLNRASCIKSFQLPAEINALDNRSLWYCNCPFCKGVVIKEKQTILRHIQNHLVLTCQLCSNMYIYYKQYEYHLISCHDANISLECIVCNNLSFKTFRDLMKHVRDHLTEKVCVYCNYLLPAGKQNMYFHLKENHNVNVFMYNQCTFCDKMFHSEEVLNDHIVSVHSTRMNETMIPFDNSHSIFGDSEFTKMLID